MNSISLLKRLLTHPYLALILRLYIGGLFIYAGLSKINNIGAFTVAIATYGIVSYSIAEIMAMVSSVEFSWLLVLAPPFAQQS